MPHVSGIFLYPVKSLDAVSVGAARILSTGALADDRRFAIVDETGRYVNGKRNPRVHQLRSSLDPVTQVLTVATGADASKHQFHVEDQREPLEQWLSEYFGFPVFFRENNKLGFPDDTDSPGPTFIGVATLREIGHWFGLTLEQTRYRFRSNIEIDGVPPFWEDRLYGQRGTTMRFRLGGATFDGINPCQRCVVPTRDPLTGQDLPDFAKRFVELRKKYLPDWAEPTRFNQFYRVAINTRLVDSGLDSTVRVGDELTILGPTGTPEAATPAKTTRRWQGQLQLIEKISQTPSVCTFRLGAVGGGEMPFSFLPGQHLSIDLPIDGATHRRSYTIASSPAQRAFCDLTIKREASGIVSRYLHDRAEVGTILDASGPSGRFVFTGDEADSILMIAGGVGITPLMSKIRFLAQQRWGGSIDLICSARTESELIFRGELESLARKMPNLRISMTLTGDANETWRGDRGRIDAAMIQRVAPNLCGRRIHICGPTEMAAEMRRVLTGLGAAEEQIFSEAFGGARRVAGPANGQIVGQITFSKSGKSTAARQCRSILDSADDVGISIDRGCLSGVCGRCKVKLISGDVQMEVEDGLTAEDQANGMVLACQAKPISDVTVAL